MSKKGQSATEYMMTYGWALLAITIVAGLLYLYVFQERTCASSGAMGFPQVQGLVPSQNEFSIDVSETLEVLVENRVGKEVTVTQVEGPAGLVNIADVQIPEGESRVLSIPGFITNHKAGECYSHTVSFYYVAAGSSIEQKSTGTLYGRY